MNSQVHVQSLLTGSLNCKPVRACEKIYAADKIYLDGEEFPRCPRIGDEIRVAAGGGYLPYDQYPNHLRGGHTLFGGTRIKFLSHPNADGRGNWKVLSV